jgi:hypothetical protein
MSAAPLIAIHSAKAIGKNRARLLGGILIALMEFIFMGIGVL